MSVENHHGQILLVCVAALVISSSSLLVKASQVNGVILYSKFSVTFLSEFLKLCIASTFCFISSFKNNRHEDDTSLTFPALKDVGLYSMPAILYLITNNMKYPILERINPGVFAVVWNLKIIGVAFLLYFVLRRKFTCCKWLGIFLLVVGSSLAELSQWNHKGSSEGVKDDVTADIQGIILLVVALVLISVANVTCEFIYKRPTDSGNPISLHRQNVVLYSWGLTLNAIAWSLEDINMHETFFQSYTHWTVAVVIMNGLSGYLIGAMFKYIDSIVAIYADLVAMFITAIVSAVFFELDINLLFCLGFVVSSLSIWVYYNDEGTMEKEVELEALNPDTIGNHQVLNNVEENVPILS